MDVDFPALLLTVLFIWMKRVRIPLELSQLTRVIKDLNYWDLQQKFAPKMGHGPHLEFHFAVIFHSAPSSRCFPYKILNAEMFTK